MIDNYKKHFAKELEKHTGQDTNTIINLIEKTPENISGDLAYPCFQLAKEFKKAPQMIANDIAPKLKSEHFSSFEVVGAYINAHLKIEPITKQLLKKINEQKENYAKGEKKEKTVVIESPGPNTNKPLHLGHIRNMLLGNSLAAIYKFLGYDVKKVDIINDRGVHICKSMLAYKLFANNQQPDKKTDHFVGDRYVRYAIESEKDSSLKEKIQEMLVLWEQNNRETRDIRKKMNSRAIKGMQQTYERFGTHIDKAYYESDHYMKGKEIVLNNIENGIFNKKDAQKVTFKTKHNPNDEKVVIRADGTSIYITQDIALGKLRYEDFHMDHMIYVVGSEQEYHFQVLFEIFEKLGYPFASGCYHMSYGMVMLPEGKMKSREGKVVDADNLADEMHETAYQQVKNRYPDLDKEEAHQKAEKIAMAAIKFFVLNHESTKDFVFFPDKSLAFEGETGPYIQYTYARCQSILKKANIEPNIENTEGLDTNEDRSIIIQLASFQNTVEKAGKEHRPNLITKYLFELGQLFNNYYQKHQIITDEKQLTNSRLVLTQSVAQVLKNGLKLLGIDAPEKM